MSQKRESWKVSMMKSNMNILFVEDNKLLAESTKLKLSLFGNVDHSLSLKNSLELLKNNQYDIAFIDLDLEYRKAGVELLKYTTEKDIYSVIMTAHNSQQLIDTCYQLGANDYFIKGNEKTVIPEIMNKFSNKDNSTLIKKFTTEKYITQDYKTIEQLSIMFRNANTNKPFLILGPTGIGKTFLAKNIHEVSGLQGDFINLNVANIPQDLLESMLFGAKKGSHNQADTDRTGLLEQANNGTLFLDEIAAASLEIQKKLLKAIDEKEFYPLGSKRSVKSNFRLISATCDDLDDLINKKQFRKDFYRRIKGINIVLPPLKERLDDIPLLIKYFTRNEKQLSITSNTYKILNLYEWSGNIAELIDLVDYWQTFDTGYITPDLLPANFIAKKNIDKYGVNKIKSATVCLTNEQYQYAVEMGAASLLKEIKKQLATKCLGDSKDKPHKKIKVSRATFYRFLSPRQIC